MVLHDVSLRNLVAVLPFPRVDWSTDTTKVETAAPLFNKWTDDEVLRVFISEFPGSMADAEAHYLAGVIG